jgi:hypothetical protein
LLRCASSRNGTGSSTRCSKKRRRNPNTATVDEEAVQGIERVVARRAINRPVLAEAFGWIEDFLDDDPRSLRSRGFDRRPQLLKVGERIEQTVHVIDADAIDHVLRGEFEDEGVDCARTPPRLRRVSR